MDVSISLSQEEQAAFMRILDAAVKFLGLGAVDAAVHFKNKIAFAQSQTSPFPGSPATEQGCEVTS
jgi:hypothetical protein